MNKALILFLVICIFSVHAFVKRDAPEAPKDDSAPVNINKEISDAFQTIKDQVSKSLDPEAVKKGFNEMVDSFNKVLSDLKPKEDKA